MNKTGLTINVTWPEDLHFCVPTDCSDMRIISERKAARNGSHIEIDGAFGRINRVCDDDIYRINCRSRSPLECCQPGAPHEQTLVILLESPHKCEYRLNCIDRPIAPAQGTTGRNIRDHLVQIVHDCQYIRDDLVRETRVMLANPIQFQTSLASIIRIPRNREKMIRDAVWSRLWGYDQIREEFKSRLDCYRPDFIINACTHDVGCNSRRCDANEECKKRKINNFIVENFPCAHIYSAAHPSSKHWQKRGLQLVRTRRRLTP